MADIEKCDVDECPYRKENGECKNEHRAVIHIEYNDKTERYEATVFCGFNFYEDKSKRIEQRDEILKDIEN